MTKFILKSFSELTPQEAHDIFQLRIEVFYLEQGCLSNDIDGIDPDAIHAFAYEETTMVAYARSFPLQNSSKWTFGRVLTRKSHRKRGISRKLLSLVLKEMRANGVARVHISAQAHLKTYYSSFGFKPEGEEYMEENIPHIGMD